MFETTIAGSLPKPGWLAETDKLWPAWRAQGAELDKAKRDATLLWLKEQEDAGIDIVTDGEQTRRHFVTTLRMAFPDIDVALEDLIAEGDKVAARAIWRGTHQGEYLGIAPTGRQVAVMGTVTLRIVHDKFQEGWLNIERDLGDYAQRTKSNNSSQKRLAVSLAG